MTTSVGAARSIYFSWVDGKLGPSETKRIGQAMFLLSSAEVTR
jgi:hypothetical protein